MKARYISITLIIFISLSACVPPERTPEPLVSDEETVPAQTEAPPTEAPPTEAPPTEAPPTEIPLTETPLPKVTLTSIQNGQTVPCYNDVSGTYEEGLEDYIWPVVIIGGQIYPQDVGGKSASKVSGEWFHVARFGNCNTPEVDKGKRFELLIVTANESANTEFEAYFANAIKTGDWSPMPALPSGIETQAHISVIRE